MKNKELEMAISYSYGSIVVFVFSFLVWKLLDLVWLKPKKIEKQLRKQGFNGDSYSYFSGGTKNISAMVKEATSKPLNLSDDIVPRVIPHLLQTLKKHGKNSFMWHGPKPWVLITDPDLLKEVTLNVDKFPKPTALDFFKAVANGIASQNGSTFVQHKKIIGPAFHQDKLKGMIPSFTTSTSEMLKKWEEIVSKEGSSEVDVWPYIQTLSSDALSRTAFGINYEEGRKIFELQKEQVLNLLEEMSSSPGWRFLPNKAKRKAEENRKIMNDLIMNMINTRMQRIKAGEAYDDDLLSLLLRGIDEQGNESAGMTMNDVVENCKLFYFAGQETTATLLVWTMILLSRFQEWQARAREEVLGVFGTNLPDLHGLNHLKIVNMILYEVLRLYPPVSQFLRTTTKETKYGNVTLPAGVEVSIQTMLLHHDPELWGDDVKEFKPERFAGGVAQATKGRLIFIPFGWGQRICTGQNFALLEARIAMAMILQQFSFKLSPSYMHGPRAVLTTQPQYGAHLILERVNN